VVPQNYILEAWQHVFLPEKKGIRDWEENKLKKKGLQVKDA
jgi:hypothetical protein